MDGLRSGNWKTNIIIIGDYLRTKYENEQIENYNKVSKPEYYKQDVFVRFCFYKYTKYINR